MDLDSFGDANTAGVPPRAATTQNNVVVSPVAEAALNPTVTLGAASTPSQQAFLGAASTQSPQVFLGAANQNPVEHQEPDFSFDCDIRPVATSVSYAFRVLQNTCTSCMLLDEQLRDLQRAYEEQAKEVSSWRGQCLYLQDALGK